LRRPWLENRNAKGFAAAEEKEQDREKSLKATIQAAVKAKDWDKAGKALDELANLAAGDESMATSLSMTRFSVLVGKKDFPAAFKVARQMGETTRDNASYQHILAELLTTDKSIEHPDLDLAQTLAQRAVDLAEDGVLKSIYLDTLARVQFMKGNKEEAIALEQKALDLIAGNDKSKDLGQKIQRALDDFKQGELPKPIWERLKPAAKQTVGKNSSGDRREVMLWGDGHVEFYQFPPDVQDEMFSSDPNPNYVFWEGQFPASTAPGEHQFDGGLRALNARFDQLL